MTERNTDLLSGQIVDETTEITIVELCRSCAVDAELVEAMINEGIIEPTRKRGAEWCFTMSTVRRTRVVARLQRFLPVVVQWPLPAHKSVLNFFCTPFGE